MPEIEIRQMPALRVAAVPHIGPYSQIAPAFERLFGILQHANAWADMRGSIGVYYYNPEPVSEAEFRSHAGAVWAEGAVIPEGLEEVQVPACRAAVLTHKGPYDGLAAAWDALAGGWVKDNGAVPTGQLAYEVYLNEPSQVAPEELLTELVLPIE